MSFTLGDLKKLLETASDDTDISQYFPNQQPPIVQTISPELITESTIEAKLTAIRHACNPGDIVASLAAVKKYYEATGRKVVYLQQVDLAAAYYPGATHETVDSKGVMVTLNMPMYNMIKPLVESQEYIERMEVYNGQNIDLDFHVIRGKTFVNMPHGSIQAWLFYAFPDLDINLSKAWMTLGKERKQIEEVTSGKIIVNFTDRYRNPNAEYYFLREYAPELIFAGTEKEHWSFCNKWQLNIPRLEVKDFLELAYALRGCRFLLSNQSFIWNLATSLNIPRILEVCQYAQNCLPFYGEHNVGFLHQVGLGYYFRKFRKEIK